MALRVVKPGESSKPREKMTVAAAAADGDRLDLLIAMRDRIARAVTDDCPPRDLAALTKRLGDIVDEIAMREAAAREAGQDGSPEDETFDSAAI